MSVKHSRAGSRLIHACPCVGRAPKGTLAPRSLHRSPCTCTYTDTTTTGPGVRELVAGDNSLFVVGALGPGKEICSGFTSRSTPVEDCLLYELNGPQAIKIPSVPSLLPDVAFHPSRAAVRNFANGAANVDDAGSLCYPVFVSLPSSILNRGCEPIRSWYHITSASIDGIICSIKKIITKENLSYFL